jgi:hypothetical protein
MVILSMWLSLLLVRKVSLDLLAALIPHYLYGFTSHTRVLRSIHEGQAGQLAKNRIREGLDSWQLEIRRPNVMLKTGCSQAPLYRTNACLFVQGYFQGHTLALFII